MDMMLNLATMGLGSKPVIASIGAVRFGKDELADDFYRLVNLQSCTDAGLEIEAGTVTWWLQQPAEARREIAADLRPSIRTALYDFEKWYNKEPPDRIWSNGAAQDLVWLTSAFKAVEKQPPWPRWAECCYKTILNLPHRVARTKPYIPHHALHDARAQALTLIKILKRIKFKKPNLL